VAIKDVMMACTCMYVARIRETNTEFSSSTFQAEICSDFVSYVLNGHSVSYTYEVTESFMSYYVVYGLFNDAINSSDYVASNDRMISE
jgi:hypothetical protein